MDFTVSNFQLSIFLVIHAYNKIKEDYKQRRILSYVFCYFFFHSSLFIRFCKMNIDKKLDGKSLNQHS